MKFYSYLYRDIDGTPIYAGKGKGGRAFNHIKADTHLGYLLQKRLKDGIKLEPELSTLTTEENAFFQETALILKYGRKDLGTGTLLNRTDGGEGSSGCVPTDEARTNMSIAGKGKPKTGKRAKGIPHGPRTGSQATGVPRSKRGAYPKQQIVKCPYCPKEGGIGLMKQWHFSKCRFKLT